MIVHCNFIHCRVYLSVDRVSSYNEGRASQALFPLRLERKSAHELPTTTER